MADRTLPKTARNYEILCRATQGWSLKEIAQHYDLSVGRVNKIIHRECERYEIEYGGWDVSPEYYHYGDAYHGPLNRPLRILAGMIMHDEPR